jgi:medium-chain acyl-[acyl-carrier-protein] hydrolase
MKYNFIYTKTLKNSFSNIGQAGELKIVNIMNLLQDIAVEYALKLKISSKDLIKKKLFWVISRYQIEINDTACLNEDIKISVTRSAHKRLYDLRRFIIETESKNKIVNAIGSWVIINKQTGSPCHLDKFMTEEMLCENNLDVEQFFYSLQDVHRIDYQYIFKIRTHDLDLNRHVNNATYVEWAVETLPEEILMNFRIKKINITFLKESFYPGHITSLAQINNTFENFMTYHSILNGKKEYELARLNIIWKPL